jgi:hypothetical protein
MRVRPGPPLRIWRRNGSNSACPPASPQIFLAESIFVQKFPQDVRESRVSGVVLAVDLLTTLCQVMFQVPIAVP